MIAFELALDAVVRQLSAQDAWFLFAESARTPMHIGSLSIYDATTGTGGRVGCEQVVEQIAARARASVALRRKVVRVPFDLDYPYWADDDAFDVASHVRRIALPEPGDWHALCALTARLHEQVLDRSAPLWVLYVIEGLERIAGVAPGAFAIVSKLHHAAADGAAGVEIQAALHDQSPLRGGNPLVGSPSEPMPTPLDVAARAVARHASAPLEIARAFARGASALFAQDRGLGRAALEPALAVPRTRFNASVSAHRVFDGRSFALDAFQTVARAVRGATINDVALSICGGALQRYLATHDERPSGSLVALAPINIRRGSEARSAGNRVAAMRVALRNDIADPLERLATIHAATTRSKAAAHAFEGTWRDAGRAVLAPTLAVAAQLVTRWHLAEAVGPICNAIVTNVPGPRDRLSMCGARLVAQFGLGPIVDGVALFIAILSAADAISVSVTSCRALMRDPERFGECIDASFAESCAAARK